MSAPPRYTVKVPSIDPAVPPVCVACLAPDATLQRRLVFRRADGTKERVCAVAWPYCPTCHGTLAGLDRAQRAMTWAGLVQMALVVYAVGGAIGQYDFWFPSLGILGVFFFVFMHFAKKARALWSLEYARIDDVYKGGIGACFSFRNATYAERFATANSDPAAAGPTSAASAGDANASQTPAATAGG